MEMCKNNGDLLQQMGDQRAEEIERESVNSKARGPQKEWS